MKNDQISQEIWILLPKIAGWPEVGSCSDLLQLHDLNFRGETSEYAMKNDQISQEI